jgi:hypothetical protein
MKYLLALWMVLVCVDASLAQDGPYNFMGRSWTLPTPAGFCSPDQKNSYDASFTETKSTLFANSGDTVVKLAAACNELRQRDFPYDFIAYYHVTAGANFDVEGTRESARKTLCDQMRTEAAKGLKDVPDIVNRTAKELNRDITVGKVENLGVLAEDAHGCYSALLVGTKNSQGPYTAVVVVLATVAHARWFFASLNSKYDGPGRTQALLAQLRGIAAELDSKNPE